MKSKNYILLTNSNILRYNTLDCGRELFNTHFPPFLLGVVAPATPTRDFLSE